MNSNAIIKLKRLQKQQQSLINDPPTNILVKRDGQLNFYFCIYGLDGQYKGGYYYGLLELHESYPFAAPKLFFYTASGRFELNMPICTSFTNYHQQSWTSAWSVRSLLLATVSFMTSTQASYGCRNDSFQVKQVYAQRSLYSNVKIVKFCELFYDQLKELKPAVPEKILQTMRKNLKLQTITQKKDQILLEEKEDQHLQQQLHQNLNQNQNIDGVVPQNPQGNQRNKCRKIIITCGVAVIIIGTIIFLAAK